MTLISGGGFLPSDSLSEIISTNFQKIVLIFTLTISMLNFYLIFNIFDKKNFINNHSEDLYLIIFAFISILLIYFANFKGLEIIINILSSISNSGITLVENKSNLSLYFLIITIVGGSLVSNSSGIKFTRLYILLKITSSEILN